MKFISRVMPAMILGMAIMVPTVKAETVKMTFEGLADNEIIGDYYNGGYGYDYVSQLQKSGPGPNFGVTFKGIYAAIDSDLGGGGNFGGAPSPKTAAWLQQSGGWMNVAGGFSERLSFYYSNPNNASKVYIYDGLDKTGNLLATIDLPVTSYQGAPDPTGNLSPLVFATAGFTGVAKSVDFGEEASAAYIDDITLGSDVDYSVTMPFEGLTDWEILGNYYNGGYGYDYNSQLQKSGPGPNYGVTFQGFYAGMNDTSTSVNTGVWIQQPGGWMNVPAGFSELSLYYYNPNSTKKLYLYDGLDKTGNLVATLDLTTSVDYLGPLGYATVSVPGIAKSADFGETANSAAIDNIRISRGPVPAHPIPGQIDAENNDRANALEGNGVSVGIATCTEYDPLNGFTSTSVCNIDTNDWIDLKVNVATAGTYTITYRVYNGSGAGNLKVMKVTPTTTTLLNSLSLPKKAAWSTIQSSTFSLAAGEQTLRIISGKGDRMKLDYVNFTKKK